MHYRNFVYLAVIICIVLISYALPPLSLQGDNKTFLTISAFLFAIFAGFFISRQSTRSSEIRSRISHFDGILSFIYRSLDHFDPSLQQKIAEVIKRHYGTVLTYKQWNYHLTHHSTTLQSIHTILHDTLGEESLKTLRTNTLNRIAAALLDAQIARKDMVALYFEKIPKLQWAIMYFLAFVMFISIATIPSQYLIVESLLKTAFVSAILCALLLLSLLNDLRLFEEIIGENSARDVLAIVEGTA